jgi:hypothetical protein
MTSMIGATTKPAQRAGENFDKVRKIIQDVCTAAGASVAIDDHVEEGGIQRRLQITYTGERPMSHANWVKLVDSIDVSLEPSGLIDWESSELSEENDEERRAAWAIIVS